ncbi:MAG: RelA/SpoT family protein, partial [Candidatus Dormibacteraceae bacterium]
EIYATLAHRLGIWQIKWELEDLAFRILQPDAYQDVVRRMNRKRQDREALVSDLSEILARELEAIGIEGNISGRPKHVCSIWQKMVRDRKDFSQIYDLQALRVTVDTIKDCYGVLGVVHSIWKPLPGRFKDYIAMRKSNGYQSLHTTVISHTGEPIEVQIRTHEMHQIAEFGIAAHWLYKEKAPDSHIDRKLEWLRLLMEWQKEVSDAESFVDAVKVDIFQDEVFVFSPRGDVFNLPRGSTPVDFAFRVHTEVGNRCIGAKVNGRMVPLDCTLSNGEIVEILTSREPKGPSRDWLNFVQSASARDRIRKWFKSQRREENVAKGRDLLEKELGRMHRLTISQLPEGKLEEMAQHYHHVGVDEFLAAIGYGDLSPHPVVMRLSLARSDDGDTLKAIPLLPRSMPTPQVLVRGEKGILTRSAVCCQPVPGDSIIGFTTRGKGITIHHAECTNAIHPPDPRRVLQVDWDMEASELYPVSIKIEAWDRSGLLRDIAAVVAEQKVNLLSASAQVYDDKTSVISATLEIDSMAQLSRLMEKLEHIRDVHTVAREAG